MRSSLDFDSLDRHGLLETAQSVIGDAKVGIVFTRDFAGLRKWRANAVGQSLLISATDAGAGSHLRTFHLPGEAFWLRFVQASDMLDCCSC